MDQVEAVADHREALGDQVEALVEVVVEVGGSRSIGLLLSCAFQWEPTLVYLSLWFGCLFASKAI